MVIAVRTLLLLVAVLTQGCASRATLHKVVLDYDETVSRAQAEMLLLNVARARHQRPLHFTTVSGIAATFDYRTDAALGGALAENPGISILTPSVGVSASENPTISIVPIQGEEFTRRLLTPLDESIPAFFYHQGVKPELLLRLIAHAIIVQSKGERALHLNDPLGPDSDFDQFTSLVGDFDESRKLDVGPLVFEESWDVGDASAPSASDLVGIVEQGYDYRSGPGGGILSRRLVGRQVITNYDLATLSNAERIELQRRAQEYPPYFVLVDIRAQSASERDLQGWIKLRSLSSIVDATANAMDGQGSGAKQALRIVESLEPPRNSLFTVAYEGLYYSLGVDEARQDPVAFRVLYRLYQMAVSELSGTAVPPVTIAK